MKPTFCKIIKEEIIKNEKPKPCCVDAFLAAAVYSVGAISIENGIATTELRLNPQLVAFTKELLDKKRIEYRFIDGKKPCFVLENCEKLLRELEVAGDYNGYMDLVEGIGEKYKNNECCARSLLKGLFIYGGSVKIPYISELDSQVKGGYHLEIVTGSLFLALDAQELFAEFGFDAKTRSRSGTQLLYFKSSDEIGDILIFFGATRGMLDLENSRILRSMRANVNRQSNCVNANITRAVEASQEQIIAINCIIKAGKLNEFDETSQKLAQTRLENPEATLDELVELMNKVLSKSAIYHRLKRIIQKVDEIDASNT
ncbi:MAG: DNA-binding protein WhiA [Clostridia bacterium]|nr:DNA-binding protein WhiA [Clostridia bacterium]